VGKSGTILVVDDEERLRVSLGEILGSWGYEQRLAADGRAALAALSRGGIDLALVDVRMPAVGGMDVLRRARALAPDLPVVMMTGYPSVESAVVAMKYGAVDFYTKPLDLPRLKEDLERILAARASPPVRSAEGVEGDISGARLAGESQAIRDLRASIARVAPTDAPVVITGESGTGKELAAEALHALSRRGRNLLLKVNCTAIPEGLLESELFGHERGAFTGADARKAGLMEQAHGGTVLLDEIGDMDLRLQAKLLRFLQDGGFRRVGGSEQLRSDARVVAATHRDLVALIAAGEFREDLYYRLSVICLRVPPLREHLDDVPLLARRFVAESSLRYGKPPPALGTELLTVLLQKPWPGNVRELKNCMERAVIFCDGPVLGPEHLPDQYRAGEPLHAAGALGHARELVERGLLLDALARAGGNRTRAAELLGINRRTLYYKLERLGIDPDGSSRDP
jgi:DNA-binding NtrC family response regulator